MGRFADIVAGTSARKHGVECTTLDGTPFTVDLGVMPAVNEARCLAAACKAAREAGGEARESDLTYQLEFAAQVVAIATLDPDSPAAPVPFFESVEQVRRGLDRDRILLLAEMQRRFQEQVSPVRHDLSDEEFARMVFADATAKEGDELPFEQLPRSTQKIYVRRMAVLLSLSPEDKSASTSDSEPTQKH